ncbi:MAG: hypothetical protein WAW37_18170 [Syntrophobacteraceae bacterium]
MSIPYHPHSGRRKHLCRIRRYGFRDFQIAKGWHLRGGYASKIIAGQEVMQRIVEKTPCYFLCSFQLKSDFWAELDG